MWLVIIGLSISLIIMSTVLSLHKQFGGRVTGESWDKVRNSKNFNKGKFLNKEETSIMTGFHFKTFVNYFKSDGIAAKNNIPVEKRKIDSYNCEYGTKITWFGHSTLLIQINGKNVFLDPMLSKVPAPHPMLAGKRFNEKLPMEIDEIPELDAILISHDHYDHLDYSTIVQLKHKTKMFYTPLGVGAHLRAWGVDEEKIRELDWWEEARLDNITFIATPARHFSGRGLFNRNRTLWCSWVIKSNELSLFFSGDTGYHNTFKEIGDKYGPFDLTMLECGQYNESWANIHMMPEETVQAHKDLKGKALLPIHWAAFKLSAHSWNEPVERVVKQASESNVKIVTPKIGEVVEVGKTETFEKWWK